MSSRRSHRKYVVIPRIFPTGPLVPTVRQISPPCPRIRRHCTRKSARQTENPLNLIWLTRPSSGSPSWHGLLFVYSPCSGVCFGKRCKENENIGHGKINLTCAQLPVAVRWSGPAVVVSKCESCIGKSWSARCNMSKSYNGYACSTVL